MAGVVESPVYAILQMNEALRGLNTREFAGAVRFRPMLLTAMAVVVGAGVILADLIFQGLAIALMAGEIASLLISRMSVPVLYFMANTPKPKAPSSPADLRVDRDASW